MVLKSRIDGMRTSEVSGQRCLSCLVFPYAGLLPIFLPAGHTMHIPMHMHMSTVYTHSLVQQSLAKQMRQTVSLATSHQVMWYTAGPTVGQTSNPRVGKHVASFLVHLTAAV